MQEIVKTIELVTQFLKDNPTVAALFAAGTGGSLIYTLRSFPIKLWGIIVYHTTTVVTVNNDEPIYNDLIDWFATLDYVRKARNLRLTGYGTLSPGFAYHIIWHKRVPIFVTLIDEDKDGKSSWQRRFKIVLRTIGRNHRKLAAILKEVELLDKKNYIQIYTFNSDYWRMAQKKMKRDFSYLFLPQETKQQIIESVTKFKESKEDYLRLNIPYRLGFLLAGKPGTGKTSVAFAIASLLDWPVYYLSLTGLSDKTLLHALSSIAKNCVVLIEDADSFQVTNERAPKKKKSKDPDSDDDGGSLTTSGLLNAIDGVVAPEGRILVMTTNHPEKLDPAIIRNGRVDHSIDIVEMKPTEAAEMYHAWFPKGTSENLVMAFAKKNGLTPADWQALFLTHRENHQGLVDELQ